MRTEIAGSELFFDVAGMKLVPDGGALRARPSVVVVHGGPGMDHSLLKPLFAPLAERAQVIWLDLRGHGRSERCPESQWTLEQWAGDLAAFCDVLEIERPVLAGASIGGTVAALAASRHPDRFAGLVLTSTPVGHRLGLMLEVFLRLADEQTRDTARRYWERLDDESTAAYQRLCMPLYSREPLAAEVMSRAILRPEIARAFYSSEGWHKFDLCEHARSIRCPTLVISGEEDPVAPVAAARELVGALPEGLGRLVEIPGGRHVLFQDAPAEVRAASERFLERLCPDAAIHR